MALLIHAEDVEGFIGWGEALETTEAALTELGRYGEEVNHPRRRLHAPSGARISIHAGAFTGLGAIGMRIHGEMPLVRSGAEKLMSQQIAARGGDVYVLYSLDMKELLAIIIRGQRQKNLKHAGFIDFRTACTSAVGTKHLARKDAKVMGLFGSGWQARNHVMAFHHALSLREVKVYSPSAEHRRSFCEEMGKKTGLRCIPMDEPRAAVQDSDLLLEASNTNIPVFDGEWLQEGVHITSIAGSNKELTKQHAVLRKALDETTVRRSDLVYMCLRQQALQDEDGQYFEAVKKGIVSWDKVFEIGELLVGKAPGRTSSHQITLFGNNSGMGVVDVAIAALIYKKAVAKGIGAEL
jgi:ornithine cyclodeaminase/alanine dehydrogenase-like protein (mu-crystallin family)